MRPNIAVQVNQQVSIDVILEIGEVTQSVEVTGETPLLQATTSSLGKVVDNRRILELPLVGRNTPALIGLTAGAQPLGPLGGIPSRTNAHNQGFFSALGSQVLTKKTLIDGVPANAALFNALAYVPVVDAVQEFKVQTNDLGLRDRRGLTQLFTIPTTQQFQGDFSQTFNASEQPVTIAEPLTTRPDPANPGRFLRDTLPGNRILARQLDLDKNNFGPRFGFACNVASRTVFRGGYGVYYLPLIGDDQDQLLGGSGFFATTNFLSSQDGGITPADRLSNPFPRGLTQPTGSTQGGLTLLGQDLSTVFRTNRSAYTQEWNFNLPRELPGNLLVEVAYAGKRGTELPVNLNQLPGRHLRPFPQFANATSRLSINFSNPGFQNHYSIRAERALGNVNIPQRFVLSYDYELPFRHRWLGGWQVNGISTFQSGPPPGLETSANQTNSFGDGSRPNNSGKSAKLGGPTVERLNRCFDTSVFSQPAPFVFGNTSRTLPDVREPGLVNFDFSIIKNTRPNERINLQFQSEFFNLLNNTNFGAPGTTFGTGTFRVIGGAFDALTIQLGLKPHH